MTPESAVILGNSLAFVSRHLLITALFLLLLFLIATVFVFVGIFFALTSSSVFSIAQCCFPFSLGFSGIGIRTLPPLPFDNLPRCFLTTEIIFVGLYLLLTHVDPFACCHFQEILEFDTQGPAIKPDMVSENNSSTCKKELTQALGTAKLFKFDKDLLGTHTNHTLEEGK
ncbi:hypothetical protein EV421DRAFT_1740165 [Armillaria borealis]|uniref:Uncharacterized protein n=1 Tax=Armillaria borealis TaxID=47425 RepID=A0AA39J766_9AGAR|nr:hypothetical protein EV421DRAFT_1740165 [Armillaria borealis]